MDQLRSLQMLSWPPPRSQTVPLRTSDCGSNSGSDGDSVTLKGHCPRFMTVPKVAFRPRYIAQERRFRENRATLVTSDMTSDAVCSGQAHR